MIGYKQVGVLFGNDILRKILPKHPLSCRSGLQEEVFFRYRVGLLFLYKFIVVASLSVNEEENQDKDKEEAEEPNLGGYFRKFASE
ncbi:hypothetical protein [Cohnella sp. AR92]|uniref:hypothetical protein n=1 Tax=Cohnella sp. AR92 TaxID=648716 RepID=UPI001EE0FCA7|nr:hypothetical protein [Cohnella sp. AR92]